jgi:hypothetical protein
MEAWQSYEMAAADGMRRKWSNFQTPGFYESDSKKYIDYVERKKGRRKLGGGLFPTTGSSRLPVA